MVHKLVNIYTKV